MGVIKFNPLGGGSGRLDVNGSLEVPVVNLDESVDERITFIKMDIEGAEREAIIGAANHIRVDKPKMSICLYHRPDDIRIIVTMLNELNPNYQFFLRHYSLKHKETVLYCF